MRRVVLWILLLALALAVVILVVHDPVGAIAAFSTQDIASLLLKIGVLVLVAGAAATLFRDRFAQAIQFALIWAIVGMLLALGYTYRLDLRDVYDRLMAELIPGRTVSRGQTVQLVRGQGGDFQISAQVNGHRVPMVLDTGATSVVLTNEAARAAGLPLEVVKYTVDIDTANGRARAAQVTLDRVAVGNIVERAVPALIAQPGQLKTSLLGMSFLNRLESWEVRGEKLMLRGYP